jgi:DNA-binding NarL/FixJ family response regulator
MKILIIEDDLNKIEQLAAHVRATIPDAVMEQSRSYRSGLKQAIEGRPDLIVLDMTLPTYDIGGIDGFNSGRTRAFAGREILAQLSRRGVESAVIVVTQFDRFGEGANAMTLNELNREMQTRFAKNYVGTVSYQPSESGWRGEFSALLRTREIGSVST